jgi:hypothetical protein
MNNSTMMNTNGNNSTANYTMNLTQNKLIMKTTQNSFRDAAQKGILSGVGLLKK